MKKILFSLLLINCFNTAFSQDYIPYYATIASQVSADNVVTNLQDFEALGVKRRGTPALQNTLNWLKDHYTSFGYTAAQMEEFSFQNAGTTCKNLVITKVGTVHPDTFVIICGHYDSIEGTGTNDNGSGVATILEVARLLQNIPTEYSIKFINFSGEEDGLIGSQSFVADVVNATSPKMNIKLVFNIDEVGGVAGFENNTITCERDTSSPTANNAASNIITNELITCVGLYSSLNTELSYAYASDYMPFENNNEIITGFFETNETPYKHTIDDTLDNMDADYVYNVAQAATGAMMHFAVASTTALVTANFDQNPKINFFPNPTKEVLNISFGTLAQTQSTFTLIDIHGKTVLQQVFISPKQVEAINIAALPQGIYLATIKNATTSYTKKMVIK